MRPASPSIRSVKPSEPGGEPTSWPRAHRNRFRDGVCNTHGGAGAPPRPAGATSPRHDAAPPGAAPRDRAAGSTLARTRIYPPPETRRADRVQSHGTPVAITSKSYRSRATSRCSPRRNADRLSAYSFKIFKVLND